MRKLLLSFVAMVCAFAFQAIAQETTVTTKFGKNDVNVTGATKTYTDDAGYGWTLTVTGTTSFTPNAAYAQLGSSNKPASSITTTTTFPADVATNLTSVEVKMGGFSGTAGNIKITLGSTEIATGKLNATSDVTVSKDGLDLPMAGEALTVSVTGISKGVKLYYITYTFKEAAPVVIDKVETPVPSVEAGSYTEAQTISLTTDPAVATIYYSLDGEYESTDGFVEYTEPFTLTGNTVVKTYAQYEDIKSETAEYTYDINITLNAPVASVESGEYDAAQLVELTCATPDAVIYYSLTGKQATEGFIEYTHPINILSDATLTAYAQLGARKSDTVEYTYTINIDVTQGGEADVTFSNLGLKNDTAVTSIDLDEFVTLTFSKGANESNEPKYYDNGTNIRVYKDNTFTVASKLGNIVKIEFMGVTLQNTPVVSASVGTINGTYDTWTGADKEVTFTVSNAAGSTKNGQFRFTGIKVTYEGLADDPATTVLYLLTEANEFEALEGFAFTHEDGVYSLEVTKLVGNFLIGSADKEIVFGASPVATMAAEPVNFNGVLGSETYFVGDYVAEKEGDTFTLAFPWDGKSDTINMAVTGNFTTGITAIEADAAEAVYYNLQGIRVAEPQSGIYVKVQSGKATKVAF